MPLELGYQPALVGAQATPAGLRELALRAEGAGFTRLSVVDHVVLPLTMESRYPYHSSGSVGKVDRDWWDPFAVLGLWVGITSTVRLQTSVLVLPYRNPIITAKMLASLDALSGGRLEVGVGAGWMAEEFALLGSPPFEARGRVTDEYIGAFRTLWRDAVPELHGEFVDFGNLAMHPKPVQTGGIPIIVGGSTGPAMRRAARLGDGWQPLKITPADVAKGVAKISELAGGSGRQLDARFQVSVRYGVRVTDDSDGRRPGEDEDRVLVGSASHVAEGLLELAEAGATDVMLDTRTCEVDEVLTTLTALEKVVMPRLVTG